MKTFLITSIFILLGAISGCGQKKNESSSPREDTVSSPMTENVKFIPREKIKTYRDCKPEGPNCTYIKLNYIEATESNIEDKINKIINSEVLTAYEMPDKNMGNINLMMETFMKDYEKFKKQYPRMPENWSIDFTAKIYGKTSRTICLSFENSNYLGGAHPNTFTSFRNIDKQTGDTIGLTSIFGIGFEDKLNKLIDKNFRAMKKIKPGDNLSEKGDLFENKITFTHNFAVLSNKGIEFYYNAYDIAPYVIGPISVKLTADEIAGMLAASSPLK